MPVNGRQECEALDMSQSERRLFYTQGDYGLFQCSEPRRAKTYAAIIESPQRFRRRAAWSPQYGAEASLSHPPHEK